MARSLSLLLLACVSALCLAAQARGALLSASTPYTELVAQRYTAAGAPRVAQWPALCGQGVVSRLAGLPQNSSRSGFTAALLQSSQGAAVLRQAINSRANMVAGAPAASQCAPLPLGVSVADWAQAGVAAWPTPGAADGGNVTLAIATPSSVYIASCQLGASLSVRSPVGETARQSGGMDPGCQAALLQDAQRLREHA